MRSSRIVRGIGAFTFLALATALPAVAADSQRYGYFRVVDGTANLFQDGSTVGLQENHPLVTGDRLWTGGGSRVEVELPDGTILRVGGGTELSFDQLAASGDTGATSTLLVLQEGELHVVTETTFGAEAYPRIDTPNASVYLEGAGSYHLETRGDRTRVAVRTGVAEVRTRQGARRIARGIEAWIEGADSTDVQVRAAGELSALEEWGLALDEQARTAQVDESVDDRLRYGASRLESYGNWVEVDDRRAWRPYVGSDWTPYHHGRWAYTPSGLTWVSYEPWGWVPYHYGSWDFAPAWGWVWYPGTVYAPAWVYWYWGPSYVGWCPTGYYYGHYGRRWYGHQGWYGHHGYGNHFRFGVHGWAGGHANHWNRWNFVDSRRLGDHRLAQHTRTAAQIGGELPRGIIATDTRGLRTAVATRPAAAMRELAERRQGAADLPDLSRFVARDPNVPREVGRAAIPVDPQGGAPADRQARGLGWEKPIVAPGAQAGVREERGAVPGDPIPSSPSLRRGGTGVRGAVGRTRPAGDGGTASGPATLSAPGRTSPRATVGGKPSPPQAAAPRRPPGRGEWSPPAEPAAGSPALPSSRTRPPATRGAAPAARPDAGGGAITKPRSTPAPGATGGSTWRVEPRTAPPERTAPPATRPPTAPNDREPGAADSPAARRRATPPAEGGAARSLDGGAARGGYGAPDVRRSAPPRAAPQRSVPQAAVPQASVPPVRRVVQGTRRPESSAPPAPGVQRPAPSGPPAAARPDGARQRSPSPPPSSYQGGGSSRPDGGGQGAASRSQGSSERGARGGGERGGARARSGGDPDRN